jgi:hypothetical protein
MPADRIERLIREWRVAVDSVRETEGSILAFGHRAGRAGRLEDPQEGR